jgi:hypothetical protein
MNLISNAGWSGEGELMKRLMDLYVPYILWFMEREKRTKQEKVWENARGLRCFRGVGFESKCNVQLLLYYTTVVSPNARGWVALAR